MSIRRHILGTLGTHMFSVVMGLVTSIFTSRLLGPEDKGEYTLFLSSINLFVLILGFGVFGAVKYFIATREIKVNDAFKTAIAYLLLITTIFYVIVWGHSYWINSEFFLPERLHTKFFNYLLVLCFFLVLIENLSKSILQGKLHFDSVNRISMVKVMLTSLFFGFLYFFVFSDGAEMDSKFAILSYFSILLITILLLLYALHKKLTVSLNGNFLSKEHFARVINWGGITYIATLAQFLNYRVDFWFVQYFEGSETLGIYALAANLGQMFWLVPAAVANVLIAHVASSEGDNHLAMTLRIGRLIWLMGIFSIVFLYFWGDWIITFLYGEKFSRASSYLIWLMLGIIPLGVTKIYSSYIAAKELHRENMRASLWGLIFTIILNIALMPYFGVFGAIWGTIVSYSITTLYVIYVMKTRFQIQIHEVFWLTKNDIHLLLKRIRGK